MFGLGVRGGGNAPPKGCECPLLVCRPLGAPPGAVYRLTKTRIYFLSIVLLISRKDYEHFIETDFNLATPRPTAYWGRKDTENREILNCGFRIVDLVVGPLLKAK